MLPRSKHIMQTLRSRRALALTIADLVIVTRRRWFCLHAVPSGYHRGSKAVVGGKPATRFLIRAQRNARCLGVSVWGGCWMHPLAFPHSASGRASDADAKRSRHAATRRFT